MTYCLQRRIQDLIKQLRWSFLQEYSMAFSRSLVFTKVPSYDVWLRSEYAYGLVMQTYLYKNHYI